MHKIGFLMMLASSILYAQTIFINAKIYDGQKLLDDVDTLLIENGRFKKLGRQSEFSSDIKSCERVVDLAGARVLPGFIEAHGHLLSLGQSKTILDLRNRQPAEIIELLSAQTKRQPAGTWIQGRNWDQNLWQSKAFPSADMLQELGNTHPIYLRRVDSHAAWVNHLVLSQAGIDKNTKDPPGGQIIRDREGSPTGVLVDNAMGLASKLLKKPSIQDLEHQIGLALREAARVGITSFHDAGTSTRVLELLKKYADEEKLSLRIYAMLDGDDQQQVSNYLAMGPINIKDYFIVRSIKYFADGALGSRGALLLQDYADKPGSRGLSLMSKERLVQKTKAALRAGFQVSTHAIGDQANRMVLDAYAQALAPKGKKGARLRIEHAQLVDPVDHPRFAALGVIASMQPIHCTSDMPWVPDRIGPKRVEARAYPWLSLLAHQAILAFGSDAPIEDINPLLGIYAAVSRSSKGGKVYMPEQKISMKQALNGYFAGAAYAEFNEHNKGKIAEGYLADFVAFKEDILSLPKTAFLKAKPLMTVVGGRIVFKSS